MDYWEGILGNGVLSKQSVKVDGMMLLYYKAFVTIEWRRWQVIGRIRHTTDRNSAECNQNPSGSLSASISIATFDRFQFIRHHCQFSTSTSFVPESYLNWNAFHAIFRAIFFKMVLFSEKTGRGRILHIPFRILEPCSSKFLSASSWFDTNLIKFSFLLIFSSSRLGLLSIWCDFSLGSAGGLIPDHLKTFPDHLRLFRWIPRTQVAAIDKFQSIRLRFNSFPSVWICLVSDSNGDVFGCNSSSEIRDFLLDLFRIDWNSL